MAYQAMDEYQLILIGYCPHNGELFLWLFHVKQPKKNRVALATRFYITVMGGWR